MSRAYLYCEISAEHNILTEKFGHNVVATLGAFEKLKRNKSGCICGQCYATYSSKSFHQ